MMPRSLAAVIVLWATIFAGCNGALKLEDFLGGRPLTRERVVKDLLAYYQRQDPMGIPVLQLPEPIVLPNDYTISVISVANLQIRGLSQLRLEYVNVNATSLEADVLIRIPWLEVLGVYTYSTFLSATHGDMNLTLTGLDLKLHAVLGGDYESRLQLNTFEVLVTKEDFVPGFTNTTYDLAFVVFAADSLFDNIVGSAVYNRVEGIKDKINARLLEKFGDRRFPIGIQPVDLLLAGIKGDLKHKFDPLLVGNKTVQLPAGATLVATNVTVSGLSSLHRTHEVSLQLVDDRLLLVLQVGSQLVSVSAEVELSASLLPSIVSNVHFSIDSVSVWVEAQQSADVRHPPLLRRVHVTLGNFRLLSSGESTLSYLLEAAVNGLPNALRNTITSRLEPTLHQLIQRRLNDLDIEEMIDKRLQAMKLQDQQQQ